MKSYKTVLLEKFQNYENEWISAFDLMMIGGLRFHSRITELRASGHPIYEPVIYRNKNGKKHSYYSYVTDIKTAQKNLDILSKKYEKRY